MAVGVHSDEATCEDRLNRTQYAEAFARLAESGDTPLVIGIYGPWGIGKSSLMRLIEARLNTKKARTVWFDAWQHQFDDAPALSLMHAMADLLHISEQSRKLMTVIAAAFGSMLLKATTNITIDDIDKLGKRYEEERFLVREARVRLQSHFRELITIAQTAAPDSSPTLVMPNERVAGSGFFAGLRRHVPLMRVKREQSPPQPAERLDMRGPRRRLVFFIDDLDRCTPANVLGMLESLKLYLSVPGCVYFIAVDRTTVEQSLKHTFKDVDISCDSYLEKIVQLPFTIPPIAQGSMRTFVDPLLQDALRVCRTLLIRGLGDNPRQVKRFINTLALNHELARQLEIEKYNPAVLAVLLLLQYRGAATYRDIVSAPAALIRLIHGQTDDDVKYRNEKITDQRLNDVLNAAHGLIAQDIPAIEQYVYLTQAATLLDEVDTGRAKHGVDAYVAIARSGRGEDVDFLMLALDADQGITNVKMVDNALGYVSSPDGIARMRHYLFNGSRLQRNYAALFFKRSNRQDVLEEAVKARAIDRAQAFSR